jgi:hypothetical protein
MFSAIPRKIRSINTSGAVAALENTVNAVRACD